MRFVVIDIEPTAICGARAAEHGKHVLAGFPSYSFGAGYSSAPSLTGRHVT
jgi:hypothetical protein